MCPPNTYLCGVVLDIFEGAVTVYRGREIQLPPLVLGVRSIVCKRYIGGDVLTIPVPSYFVVGNRAQLVAPSDSTLNLVGAVIDPTPENISRGAFNYMFKPLGASTPLTVLASFTGNAVGVSASRPDPDSVGVGIEFVFDIPSAMPSISVLTTNLANLQSGSLAACMAQPDTACDKGIRSYCAQSATQNSPICGCINSPATSPMCNDVRCTAAAAYHPTGLTPICPSAPITCAEWTLLDNGKYLDPRAIPPAKGCVAPQSALPVTNTVLIIIMIIIVAILGVIAMRHTGLRTGGRPCHSKMRTKLVALV